LLGASERTSGRVALFHSAKQLPARQAGRQPKPKRMAFLAAGRGFWLVASDLLRRSPLDRPSSLAATASQSW